MNIAELFVDLGIKNDNKALKSLTSVKNTLGDVKLSGLAAKAAILSAFYGLQQMTSKTAQYGSNLSQFASATGLSVQRLQEFEYAARQFNVGSDEMVGSIKGVQDAMVNMLMGKGAPEGLGMLSDLVGFDPEKARDTFYVFEQIQKFAQQVPADVARMVGKSFGLSDNMIAAMRRNAFNAKAFARANALGGGEIEKLRKVDVAWENLGDNIQKMIGRLNAKHGLNLVRDVSNLTTEVLKLVDAFATLADKLKIFDVVSEVFSGWTDILKLINGESIDDINKGKPKKERQFGQGTWWMNAMEKFVESTGSYGAHEDYARKLQIARESGRIQKNQNININQNLNFQHDGKNAKDVGNASKKSVNEAFRQMSAQVQGG